MRSNHIASVTKNGPSNPRQVWRPGIDPAADALERVSVLIGRNEHITAVYAFSLGESVRHYADQCTLGFRLGLEMVLIEQGNKAAIFGWRHAPAPNPTAEASVRLGDALTTADGFYIGVDSEEQTSPVNRTRTLDRTRLFARP